MEVEKIIKNLLCSDNNRIKQASADLRVALRNPMTFSALCEIIGSHETSELRQYSAILLKKHLGKLHNWQMLTLEQQLIVKRVIMNALITEKENLVRNAIAQCVGALVRHDANTTCSWMDDVLKLVYTHCSSSDTKDSELGSYVFAALADVAPDLFAPYMKSACEMFMAAFTAAEASGNRTSQVILNIFSGMTYLVPFILGHNIAKRTYQKGIPVIVKYLHNFAFQLDSFQFVKAFQILDSMADHTPKLLTNYVKLIVNFCLELAANPQLANAVRVKSVAYVGRLIRLKKKIIIKQELIEHIIQVVFNLMTIETGSCCGDYDTYFLDEDNSNPTAAAMQTMQLMASNIPPGKFISPLLQLVQPALKKQNPLFRRAAYLSMAFIFEGSSKAMCSKCLNNNLNVVKVGITDIIPVVRNAAFFTLAQFSAHLQEDITRYTPQILPIFLECLQQLCNELRSGSTEPKHINGIFYALKKFCQNVEIVLGPDLHLLMGSVLEISDLKNSLHVRGLALYAISAVSTAAKANMLPYLQQVIAILQIYIVKTESENILPLRPQAIDTLAVIALKIGKENFMPLVSDAMGIVLTFLEGAKDDPNLRRALYNLIASLAELINEKMASVYPRFIEYLFQSILSTGEVIHEYKEDIFHVHMQENAGSEIGIGDADQEDDELFAEYSVDNSLLDEKEQAIWTLKKLADHTGSAFLPYLDQSCQKVYEMIDHPQEDIRRVCINALTSFVIVRFREQNVHDGSYALKILVRKLGHIVREDEEAFVVYAALQNFSDLLRELKQNILSAEEIREIMFACINDVLRNKVTCYFSTSNGAEETKASDYEENVVKSAGNLLPLFGLAMSPEKFFIYFQLIYPIIVAKCEKGKKKKELQSQRAFAYGILAQCFAALQTYTCTYFDIFCSLMIEGLADEFDQARQNAAYGLGELVLYAGDKSFQVYPHILTALSQAVSKEFEPAALDNICGTIARLIITNCDLVPLNDVLPKFLQNLPLRKNFEENTLIFKCFKLLYMRARDHLVDLLERMLAIAVHVLYNKQFTDQETFNNAIEFLREIRDNYPETFNAVACFNPEILSFFQTL
ncbi:importin-4-like [Glossina fuscipes]|uniref:Importin-4-like n=1 Tax=Glossina fuscipes TaxID=7396 RepID=A0A8U0WJU8_9MUSC|nr:importin-4-like [Glossina fuscipes]